LVFGFGVAVTTECPDSRFGLVNGNSKPQTQNSKLADTTGVGSLRLNRFPEPAVMPARRHHGFLSFRHG
jgi:hypothetical protein